MSWKGGCILISPALRRWWQPLGGGVAGDEPGGAAELPGASRGGWPGPGQDCAGGMRSLGLDLSAWGQWGPQEYLGAQKEKREAEVELKRTSVMRTEDEKSEGT